MTAVLLLLLAALPRAAAADGPGDGQPFVRPGFGELIAELRPQILAAAARHNDFAASGLSDREFAAVIALILYNEHVGWAEELLPPLQIATPGYQELQRRLNQSAVGSNFSIWPANLRPSVAIEILHGEVPLADGSTLTMPLTVNGSRINLLQLRDGRDLQRQVSVEIGDPQLAVEYLAANLARGVRRAQHEGVTVSWQVLAAWHNRGIVDPRVYRADAAAVHYLQRASAYLDLAEQLVSQRSTSSHHPV